MTPFMQSWSSLNKLGRATVEDLITGIEAQQRSGEYVDLGFKGASSGAALNDLGSAFGGHQYNTRGIINVDYNQETGDYSFTGTIYYTFSDGYFWRPGVTSVFDHDAMDALRTEGFAETFWTRAYFQIDIEGSNGDWDYIGDYRDSFDLRNHTEMPANHHYGMPEIFRNRLFRPTFDFRDQNDRQPNEENTTDLGSP